MILDLSEQGFDDENLYLSMVVLLAALLLVPGCAQEAEAPMKKRILTAISLPVRKPAKNKPKSHAEEEGAAEQQPRSPLVGPAGDETVITLDELKEMEAVELEAESKGEKTPLRVRTCPGGAGTGRLLSNLTPLMATARRSAKRLPTNAILVYEGNGADLSGDEKTVRSVGDYGMTLQGIPALSKIEVKCGT